MAAIVWSDVVAHASELSSVASGAQDDILGYVNDNVEPDMFDGESGKGTKLARVYLAAHLGTVAKSKGSTSTGAVTSETAGRLTRSYAVLAAAATALGSSSYGVAFETMVNRSAARVPFVP